MMIIQAAISLRCIYGQTHAEPSALSFFGSFFLWAIKEKNEHLVPLNKPLLHIISSAKDR
jgi:hypothetical protein